MSFPVGNFETETHDNRVQEIPGKRGRARERNQLEGIFDTVPLLTEQNKPSWADRRSNSITKRLIHLLKSWSRRSPNIPMNSWKPSSLKLRRPTARIGACVLSRSARRS